jgi:predicted XRE-type DNA-binding protein
MSKRKMSEKEFWESNGLKYYDSAWEAIGLTPEEAELEETRFQMAQKIKELAENATLDSLFKAFRALGVSTREFSKMFRTKRISIQH